MKQKNNEVYHLDIINYLAIDSLEKIDNVTPTELEIVSIENALALSINSTLKEFQTTCKK